VNGNGRAKEGKDPSTEKQLDKHRQAAARPLEQWADEWLTKKKVEKVKRGRIVAVRDPKTIEVLELRVGYVKDRFGELCRQDIKRSDVLAFEISTMFETEPNGDAFRQAIPSKLFAIVSVSTTPFRIFF
jgi:hypothetical protein